MNQPAWPFAPAVHSPPPFLRPARTLLLACILGAACATSARAWAQSATTTVLAITAGGVPIANVNQQTPVTLTATVLSGNSPITQGQVNFCEVKAPPLKCTDIRLLGTAQLTAAGTATLRFQPGLGSHTYQAVFLGTHLAAASASSEAPLTVAPYFPTSTVITAPNIIAYGTYTFGVTVTGSGGTVAPTGTVSILDTSNANYVLGTAAVVPGAVGGGGGGGTTGLSFSYPKFYEVIPFGCSDPNYGIGIMSGPAIAVADFNGDGKPDVAMPVAYSSATPCPPPPPNGVWVLFGNGDGTFTPSPTTPFANGISEMTVGDFNGDGKPDMAVIAGGGPGMPGISILLGNGDGTFTAGQTIAGAAAPSPLLITTGDFNGDGIVDLAVTNSNNNSVTILLGNGNGTFALKSTVATGNGPSSAAMGDFNGDRNQDLAVTNKADGTISILLGKGPLRRARCFLSTPTGNNLAPTRTAVADFNDDGILDLVVTNAGTTGFGSIVVFLGNGDGTFQWDEDIFARFFLDSVAVGDFNGDGFADFVALPSSGQTLVLLGNGDGIFQPEMIAYTYGPPGQLAVADFNGDGLTDIVTPEDIPHPDLGTPPPEPPPNPFPPNGIMATLLAQNGSPGGVSTATATVSDFFVVGSGRHYLVASYSGDNNYSASVSSLLDVNTEPEPTTLAFTASPSTINYSQSVTLTAIVSPSTAQNHSATGSVTFTFGNTIVGIAPINAAGAATFATSMLPSGVDTITATYSGDTNFATSSADTTETVNGSQSVTTLAVGPNPAKPLQPVTITATVSGISFPQTPTGSVTFYNGATVLAKQPLNAVGTATFTTSSLPFGNYPITAVYSGDPAYYASTSTPITLVITGYVSTTALTASPNPGDGGQMVTLTANVAGVGTATVPTGTVTFYAGVSPLGSVAVGPSGLAVFTTTTLPIGVDSLMASYAGSAEFTASTSAPVSEVIIKPDFSVALATPSITLAKYKHTTTTITLGSLGAFADTVTLTCGKLPTYLTCLPTPASTPLAADGSVTASLYLDTDSIIGGDGKSGPLAQSGPRSKATLAFLLLPLSALGLRRRRRGTLLSLVLAFLALPIALGLTSCGGSILTPVAAVAPGTYIIAITATGASTGLSHTAQLTLTVTP